jgi:iron complex outermembrane recepter protein
MRTEAARCDTRVTGWAVPIAVVLTATVLFVESPALAQEPRPPELPPVIVEAPRLTPERTQTEEEAREEIRRVPGGVDLIGQDRIEESRAANLKDVLDFTPGVLIRPRFGAADESQLSVRGSGLRNNFHLRGINILIDGFPYGNADGFSDFEALELLTVKRIEVYKAANALRFGANSLGGAINLITKTGYDVGPLELRSEAGSFGYLKNYLGTGHVFGPLDLYAGFTDTELEGFRDHSEQVRRRAYATFGYRLDGGATVRLDLGYARVEEELPGSLTRDEFERNPRQRNPASRFANEARNYDYTRGAVTFRMPLTETQALEWGTQLNYQDLDHPLSFAVIDDTTYSWSSELRWILAAPVFGRGNRLTVGLQYFSTRMIDANLANVLGHRGAKTKDQVNVATNWGLYAEDQFDVTPTFAAVVGGRGQYARRSVRDRFFTEADTDRNDSDSVDFLSVTPTAGVIWKAAPTVQVFANASRSYEPPLLLELTAPGQIGGDLSELEAQKAWQFEVGTRGTIGTRASWDVSVYDIELWDEIQNVNVQPFPGAPFTVPRFRNVDRSRHTGVEAGFGVRLVQDLASRLGLGTTGDTLGLRAAYTWSRFVFVDDPNFGNNDLPGAPEHFIRSELRYEHRSGFWLAPNVEIVPAGYFVNSENTARTSPYELYNISVGYDYKPWNLSVFFEARNLADTKYISAVTVDDANQRFFQPGDGRAFYGGLQWRWR